MKAQTKAGIIIAVVVACAIIVVISAYMIVTQQAEYAQGDTVYGRARIEYVAEPDEAAEDAPSSPLPQIDFASLTSRHPDVLGWIYSPDTVIDYPVVQGSDNDFYLTHLYDGSESKLGSIFMDYLNAPDFSDQNTILYGHHMKNGSMFASLTKYADQSYYNEHPVIYLLTPEKNYRLDLFSGYTMQMGESTDLLYLTFGTESEYARYLEQIRARSDFMSDVLVGVDDQIVTLCTCTYDYDDARYLVHARLTELYFED